MIVFLILSLHLLLLSLYASAIEQNLSRLQYTHLIFAACIPLVGELCLLLAETGRFHAEARYISPFNLPGKNETSKLSCETSYIDAGNIGREELMEIIKNSPANLPLLLKVALNSSDAEVAHIAAASIMKIQRTHEELIKKYEEEFSRNSLDMHFLNDFIDAINDYLKTSLLDRESANQFMNRKLDLLQQLLKVSPKNQKAKEELNITQALLNDWNGDISHEI